MAQETLVPLTAGYYAKHSLYTVGEAINETYILFYSQAEYSTLISAVNASLPTTSQDIINPVTIIACPIVQQGATGTTEILDERPVIGFKSSGVTASADHTQLLNLNLGDSGHHQFLTLSGSTSMAGTLNMNNNSITGISTANGVVIENHEARHLPNGADPLVTEAPTTNLSPYTSNSVGIQNSLARSDHSHAIVGFQIIGTQVTGTSGYFSGILTIQGGITGSSAFFTSITGCNVYTPQITGQSAFFTAITGYTITGSSAFFTSITGTSLVAGSSHTGSSAFFTTITGISAFFGTITGYSVYAPQLTGQSAFFNSITGYNIYSPQLTGQSAFFLSITGYNVSAPQLTGQSAFFNSITGYTITGSSAFFTSITGTNSIAGLSFTGQSALFTSITGSSAFFNTITGGSLYSGAHVITGQVFPYMVLQVVVRLVLKLILTQLKTDIHL